MSLARRYYVTTSAAVLVLANLVTIGFAVWENWDVRELLWIYWIQGLIIGMFGWVRILNLKRFTPKPPKKKLVPGFDQLSEPTVH